MFTTVQYSPCSVASASACTSSALRILDRETGEPREGSTPDFVEYVKLANGLKHIDYLSTAFIPKDVPQDGLTHWYTVTNAGEVHDHRGHFDMNGGQLEIAIPTEGKVFNEVVRFKRKGKSIVLNWTVTVGGTLREKGELTLTPKTK